jgi:hypothetical protein
MASILEIMDDIILNFKAQRSSQGFYVPLPSLFSSSLTLSINSRNLTKDQVRRLMLLAIDRMPKL